MPARKAPNNIGRYLYALTNNRRDGPCGFPGINRRPVHAIAVDQLAAVVSDLPRGRMPCASRCLSIHEYVLKRLMGRGPVLPVVPGTVADSSLAVRRALLGNEDVLLQRLDHVTGKVEMRVRVTALGPSAFQYLQDRGPERHEARDRVPGTHEQTCDDELTASRRRAEQRQACRREVEDALAACCLDTRHVTCRTAREVLDLACLIERTDHDRFEAVVRKLACVFDPSFAFQCTGPLPPQSFVMIKLGSLQEPTRLARSGL